MSTKSSKVQPVNNGYEDYDDSSSVSSFRAPSVDVFSSPSIPKRKRRPSTGAGTGSSKSNKSHGGSNSAPVDQDPHQKYSRTLGSSAGSQAQTTLLASPPIKLKNRSKSFSTGDIQAQFADDASVVSNNNGMASTKIQRRPSAGASLSRGNSRSNLMVRKKRVTWRTPLVDDRRDRDASIQFSRSYSFNAASSKDQAGTDDSSSGDDDNSINSGRKRKRSKRTTWFGMLWPFGGSVGSKKSKKNKKNAASSDPSSSGKRKNSTDGGNSGSNSSPPAAEDNSVTEFVASQGAGNTSEDAAGMSGEGGRVAINGGKVRDSLKLRLNKPSSSSSALATDASPPAGLQSPPSGANNSSASPKSPVSAPSVPPTNSALRRIFGWMLTAPPSGVGTKYSLP